MNLGTCAQDRERGPDVPCVDTSLPHPLLLLQGIWSRALGLPIERPKSLTSKNLIDKFGPVNPQ